MNHIDAQQIWDFIAKWATWLGVFGCFAVGFVAGAIIF